MLTRLETVGQRYEIDEKRFNLCKERGRYRTCLVGTYLISCCIPRSQLCVSKIKILWALERGRGSEVRWRKLFLNKGAWALGNRNLIKLDILQMLRYHIHVRFVQWPLGQYFYVHVTMCPGGVNQFVQPCMTVHPPWQTLRLGLQVLIWNQKKVSQEGIKPKITCMPSMHADQ